MLWTDKIESEGGDKLTTTFIKYVNKDKILELVMSNPDKENWSYGMGGTVKINILW